MRVLPDGRVEEDLTSQIDGNRTVFDLTYDCLVYTVDAFINGQPQGLPGTSFEMVDGLHIRIKPFVLRSPDRLSVRYTPR